MMPTGTWKIWTKIKQLYARIIFSRKECKKDLELVYERIAYGVKTRGKCQLYKEGEKKTKFFLNL